jgi:hypothetical protein
LPAKHLQQRRSGSILATQVGKRVFLPNPVKIGDLWRLSAVVCAICFHAFNFTRIIGGGQNHAMATKAAATGKKRMTQSEVINHFAENPA